MKKHLRLLALFPLLIACGGQTNYDLNEDTFFLVMTNIQFYPEEYVGKDISLDCFTYNVTDIDGNNHLCGVRKCSSAYGCKCGKDSVIGFILNYSGDIPEPKNQNDNTNEKTWIHISGQLAGENKTNIQIYGVNADGTSSDTIETVQFLSFNVSTLNTISDYSNLNY